MCTLIAIHRGVAGRPLVVAANRDEYFDRPAEGPAVRNGPAGPILAPLDARAGGTWLGLNAHGVFAALTNLRTTDPDPTRKSRGMVVVDALGHASAADAADALGRLPRATWNEFNCFVADGRDAYVVTYREQPIVHSLPPGVHVIGNADASAAFLSSTAPGDERQSKVDRVLGRARHAADLPADEVLDALGALCREHGTGDTPLHDTCVHAGATYGTRSSLLLELSDAPSESRLLYAEGAPCSAPYLDQTSLLEELRQTPGY